MSIELEYDHRHLRDHSPLSATYYVRHWPLRHRIQMLHHHGTGPRSVLDFVVLGLAHRFPQWMLGSDESTAKVYLNVRTGWQRPLSRVSNPSSTDSRDRSTQPASRDDLSLLTFTRNVVRATSKNSPALICSSRRQLPKQLLFRPNVVEQAVTGRSLAGNGQALSFALCSPQQLYVS